MRTFCTVLLMVGLAGCAWGQFSHMGCPSGSLPGNEFGPYIHGEKTPISSCWSDLVNAAPTAPGVELKLQKNGDVIAQPKPLKCGQHQHVEGEYGSNGSIHGRCADDLKCGKYQYVKTDTWVELNDCRPIGNGKLECSPPVPRCEDKIYPMTLAEYEQILARLKALEEKK